MSYVKSNLMPDEQLYLFTYGHWIAFAPPIIAAAVLVGGWIIAPAILGQVRQAMAALSLSADSLAGYAMFGSTSLEVLGIFIVTCLMWFGGAWLKYISSEFAITDQRVLVKRGLIFRRTNEMYLGSIESLRLSQTIPGRLFGYGTLTVVGRGNSEDNLVDVPNPDRFRRKLQEQTERYRQVAPVEAVA